MAQAALHNGPLLGERDGLRVISCHACGFAHLETLPDAAALADYYVKDFWREKPGALERIEEQREWWHVIYDDWMDCIEQYVTGRDLLDVGAGYGFFIDAVHERGWNPWGIEPNRVACEYADKKLGWPLFNGSWEDWDYGWGFNFISALWLIEHLPDPFRFLRWCHARLKEGGVLLLVAPNEWTARQARANNIVKNRYWFIDKTHCCYFNQASLSNLLGRTGFKTIEWLTTYPMEDFILNGTGNYVDNPEIGPKCHDIVEHMDLNRSRDERLAYYANLARHGEGRDIVVIATRA